MLFTNYSRYDALEINIILWLLLFYVPPAQSL